MFTKKFQQLRFQLANQSMTFSISSVKSGQQVCYFEPNLRSGEFFFFGDPVCCNYFTALINTSIQTAIQKLQL